MKTGLKSWVGALAVSLMMGGCGGGGGGGGSEGGSSGGTSATTNLPQSAAQLTVKVTVNGAAVAPDGTGTYKIKPGDTVAVVASQAASWTSTNGTSGAVTLRNPSIAGSQWSSQLVNTSSSEAVYTVTASVGTELTASSVFSIAAADARNGSYKVFATNGTRQTLTLNFDTKDYEMSDGSNPVASGSISEDSTAAGTYLFGSSRITTSANTARFKLAQDTVVGAFPFVVTQVATTSYAVQPFVASRALETNGVALDGVYNRFGIDVASSSVSSTISQFQISGNGSTLIRCADNTIYKIANCPGGSLQAWTISAGSTADSWKMTEVANPTNYAIFSIARLGGQKIFLIAGKLVTDPMASVFRLGVTDTSTWPTGTGVGASTQGSWGTVSVQAGQSTRSAIAADGTTSAATNVFGVLDPDGMRQITNGGAGASYFAMQGAKIFTIVGANSPATAGYLQINLMD